ncbi:MAG: dihydrofolate synthase, partial [Bacteroidetes bacterium HGW-Bacteroidetes-15]
LFRSRAIDEKILATQAANYGLKGKSYPTVNEAVYQAKQNAAINDLIFIGGSTFVVADALVKNY